MGEKPVARSGGFNDRNKERTHDGARPAGRSFSDRADMPVRNVERFSNNEFAGNRDNQSREINGNSRTYTKDTDMQFARELSKGFGDRGSNNRDSASKPYARKPEGAAQPRSNYRGDSRSSAPRGDAPRATTGEKFGNPRPRSNQTGDRANRSNAGSRSGGDSAPRRPRSFA
jgi:hypothetical protein